MSDVEDQVSNAGGDVEVEKTEVAAAPKGKMSVEDALQEVLKKALVRSILALYPFDIQKARIDSRWSR